MLKAKPGFRGTSSGNVAMQQAGISVPDLQARDGLATSMGNLLTAMIVCIFTTWCDG
jgi:hypothetical protein